MWRKKKDTVEDLFTFEMMLSPVYENWSLVPFPGIRVNKNNLNFKINRLFGGR